MKDISMAAITASELLFGLHATKDIVRRTRIAHQRRSCNIAIENIQKSRRLGKKVGPIR